MSEKLNSIGEYQTGENWLLPYLTVQVINDI